MYCIHISMWCHSDGGDFEESMKVVCKQMNVNSNFSYREEGHPDDDANFKVNTNNRLLWKVMLLDYFTATKT